MGMKKAASNEILELLGEITARLDELEETMVESLNSERCQLWGNQMAMVHSVQEAYEKTEKDWKVKEFEDQAFILRKDSALNKQVAMNPKLGY
ncbi:hypothetical protein ELQ35_10280 [Peribacillus cavernae]|uniref:Uncharacterized protein n=1 Tax=Peribacillus cavernae TaxID=1674310 RepID=A0A3S0TWN1_9BACI|nr:hypothetical protein [Peribacillus cavernae]MDQ0218947.1 calcineurin-like phosphoesterase family protein [Peribacillus cavernae]RUQ29344.1 hypothetical protein ELQ35_10280 [Peribacillus cavernae]